VQRKIFSNHSDICYLLISGHDLRLYYHARVLLSRFADQTPLQDLGYCSRCHFVRLLTATSPNAIVLSLAEMHLIIWCMCRSCFILFRTNFNDFIQLSNFTSYGLNFNNGYYRLLLYFVLCCSSVRLKIFRQRLAKKFAICADVVRRSVCVVRVLSYLGGNIARGLLTRHGIWLFASVKHTWPRLFRKH